MMRTLVPLLGFFALIAAPAVDALELKNLRIDQEVTNDEYPAIHVGYDRQADNWTAVTSAPVEVRVWWRLNVKAVYALAPGSQIRIGLDGIEALQPLQSANNHPNERHSGPVLLRAAGSQFVELKSTAIEICQTIRRNGGKPNKEHRITRLWPVRASVFAQTTAKWFTEETAFTQKLMRVDVVCDEDPLWREPIEPGPSGIAADLGDMRVLKAEVFLTTFQNQTTSPTPGTVCKKLQVKLRIELNKPGVMAYTLRRDPGESRLRSRMATVQQGGPLKGRVIVEETFMETFDRTTFVKYQVESRGVSSPWEEIHIICTGAGGTGGLSAAQPTDGGAASQLPQFTVLDTNLVLQRLPGTRCPARVKVTATYRATRPGSFDHFVGCSNGLSDSRTLEVHERIGPNRYGVKRELIAEVAESGELTCTARAIKYPAQLQVRKLEIQCPDAAQGRPARASTTLPRRDR